MSQKLIATGNCPNCSKWLTISYYPGQTNNHRCPECRERFDLEELTHFASQPVHKIPVQPQQTMTANQHLGQTKSSPTGSHVFYDCPWCGAILQSDNAVPATFGCPTCGKQFSASEALNVRFSRERAIERGLFGLPLFRRKNSISYREQLEQLLYGYERNEELARINLDFMAAEYLRAKAEEKREELRRHF